MVLYCNLAAGIFEYENSIRIMMVLFKYLKLFQYSSIRMFDFRNENTIHYTYLILSELKIWPEWRHIPINLSSFDARISLVNVMT